MNKKCKYCKYKEDLNGITGCFYMGADCKHGEMYEPFTNADRIRSMSDEELAEFLDGIQSCSRCRRRGNDCFPHWDVEEWLKKPAEEVK